MSQRCVFSHHQPVTLHSIKILPEQILHIFKRPVGGFCHYVQQHYLVMALRVPFHPVRSDYIMLTTPAQEFHLKFKMSFFRWLRGQYRCPLASDRLPVDREIFSFHEKQNFKVCIQKSLNKLNPVHIFRTNFLPCVFYYCIYIALSSKYYRCAANFGIYRVHTPTNALFIKLEKF